MLPIKLLFDNLFMQTKNNILYINIIQSKVLQCRGFRKSASAFCSENTMEKDVNKKLDHEKDPAPYFFNPKVQDLMLSLTSLDLAKIYKTQPRPMKYEAPQYKLMTEKQLIEAINEAKQKAVEKLQFPPILKERKPINEVLSYDPELLGYSSSKLIFVDVSYGISDRARTIVARDRDGTLRKATWDERERMNQIFFPVNKRKLGMPQMFLDENLQNVLTNEEYEYILDRACLQFEPDSPDFIRVCHQTFDHIDSRQKYDVLLSTRHYGPMVFYLAFYSTIDNLLIHLIQNDRVDKAADAIRLYHLLNPESSKSASTVTHESAPFSVVKEYVKLDSIKRPRLELAIQTYEELQKSQQQYTEDVKQAHGHS